MCGGDLSIKMGSFFELELGTATDSPLLILLCSSIWVICCHNHTMFRTSPGASPHYTPSGNSSPHHGSRTPQKGETAVDPSMNESRSKSLSSRLQVIQEIEQEDGLVSVNPATAAGGEKEVNESSAVAREEGLGSGLIKEMSKTLSDLYGAINWDDVAKTGIKNNSAALATTANNLPYISTNASLTKSQTSSSVPDFLAASSHQATKSPDASNVNNNNNKVSILLISFNYLSW